jgi:hypothetical protein
MPLYRFTGGDPRDYFTAGRVEPGQVVEWAIPPDIHWRPAAPLAPEQPPADPAPAPDAPATSEEV